MDAHRHGTWPARLSRSLSASRAKRQTGARPSAQTFDSFKTLGLAKIVLTPKALLERANESGSALLVWLDSSDRVIAYKWAAARSQLDK